MALSPTLFAGLLQVNLATKGFTGVKLTEFCIAVGIGVVNTSITLQGQITTPVNMGVSVGIGIVCSGSNISSTTKSTAIGLFGYTGTKIQDFCDALGATVQTHFLLATLVSDSNGSATFTSFTAAENSMAALIQSSASFTGPQWPNFCTAIAHGICSEIGANGLGVLAGAIGGGAGTGIVIIS
jgi:hypothetical protein